MSYKDPEKNRAYNRIWREKNPDKVKEYTSKYANRSRVNLKRWRADNPDKRKAQSWKAHLKKRYGLTAEEYRTMAAQQGGLCVICLQEPEVLCVDHDHLTGTNRGLLCRNCNGVLGLFSEDADRFQRAAEYIRKWKN